MRRLIVSGAIALAALVTGAGALVIGTGAIAAGTTPEAPSRTWKFEGPFGTFFLREDSDKPIILVAGGTGFAPIKAVIEHALYERVDREMVLYWGCRSLQDLYMPHLPAQWAKEHPNFTFIPVLSDPKPEDNWQGRTGFVHQAVVDDFESLAGYQVYACGAPIMIEVAQKAFVECGLPDDEFFADSFTYSDPAANP